VNEKEALLNQIRSVHVPEVSSLPTRVVKPDSGIAKPRLSWSVSEHLSDSSKRLLFCPIPPSLLDGFCSKRRRGIPWPIYTDRIGCMPWMTLAANRCLLTALEVYWERLSINVIHRLNLLTFTH